MSPEGGGQGQDGYGRFGPLDCKQAKGLGISARKPNIATPGLYRVHAPAPHDLDGALH